MTEKPQRWCWHRAVDVWTIAVDQFSSEAIDDWHVWVWGTESDRDAKRDLLLEAAEKAGKS